MKFLIYILSIILLLGINLGFFSALTIKGQGPNLLFLLTLCFALGKKGHDFFFIALLSGIFLDFYSTGFFGAFTLAFLIFALAIYLIAKSFLSINLNLKNLTASAGLSWLLVSLILWLWQFLAAALHLSPSNYPDFSHLISNFTLGLIYNLILLYPTYLFYDFLRRLIETYEIRKRGVIR